MFMKTIFPHFEYSKMGFTDINQYVLDQLPRAIKDRLQVEITSDPYHLRTLARFTDDRGRKYETKLENEWFGAAKLACKIPENFIAHLCAVM